MPRVAERVMVEANYNPNMPFKWNAFRIQLLPNQDQVLPQVSDPYIKNMSVPKLA